jgi:hypothetical protein
MPASDDFSSTIRPPRMLTQWWMRALLWLGLLGLGVSFSVPPRVLSRPRPVGADALFGFKARPPGASLTRRWVSAPGFSSGKAPRAPVLQHCHGIARLCVCAYVRACPSSSWSVEDE